MSQHRPSRVPSPTPASEARASLRSEPPNPAGRPRVSGPSPLLRLPGVQGSCLPGPWVGPTPPSPQNSGLPACPRPTCPGQLASSGPNRHAYPPLPCQLGSRGSPRDQCCPILRAPESLRTGASACATPLLAHPSCSASPCWLSRALQHSPLGSQCQRGLGVPTSYTLNTVFSRGGPASSLPSAQC